VEASSSATLNQRFRSFLLLLRQTSNSCAIAQVLGNEVLWFSKMRRRESRDSSLSAACQRQGCLMTMMSGPDSAVRYLPCKFVRWKVQRCKVEGAEA
jgi:hypothetical protein